MNNKVLSFVKLNNMIDSGDGIVVGLSGGADSVCLLHLLCSLKDALGIRLCAAHINHMLRGDEAERDEKYCEKLCGRLNVPFYSKRQDIAAMAKEQGISFEQCGRNARYAFFDFVCESYGYNKIATAHTLSDSVETMLFNLTRGTGPKGLCGIPPVRDNIVRPLLSCTREEIEDYCKNNNLEFMTDSTNLSDDYSRNFIRHNVVAALKEKNNSFEQAVFRTMGILRADEQYLEEISSSIFDKVVCNSTIDCDKLKNENISIRTRVLHQFFEKNSIQADYKTINAADRVIMEGKGNINLPKDKALDVSSGKAAIILQGEGKAIQNQPESEILAQLDVKTITDKKHYIDLLGEKRLSICKYNKDSIDYLKNINKKLFNNYLNYDMIIGNIIVRTRKSGDFFRPVSKGCTKSLKKLFNEAKIPIEKRNKLIILQDDEGIIWVESFGADMRCAPNCETDSLIEILVEERF